MATGSTQLPSIIPTINSGMMLSSPDCCDTLSTSSSSSCSSTTISSSSSSSSSFSTPSSSPIDLIELIDGIKEQLTQHKEVHLSKQYTLQELLRRFDPTLDGGLGRYAHFDTGKKYTRNLIATDNETFTLMLLCWTPGKESPIHDHPCDGCWMKVCTGSVLETRYVRDKNTNSLIETQKTLGSVGDVIYIDDSIALHKVGNNSGTDLACTLHLYSPPFQKCKVWLSENSPCDKPLEPVVTYHSEFGEVVNYEESDLCRG